jgi:hypothetical protein
MAITLWPVANAPMPVVDHEPEFLVASGFFQYFPEASVQHPFFLVAGLPEPEIDLHIDGRPEIGGIKAK